MKAKAKRTRVWCEAGGTARPARQIRPGVVRCPVCNKRVRLLGLCGQETVLRRHKRSQKVAT